MTCRMLAEWEIRGEKMSIVVCIPSGALWGVDTYKELSGRGRNDSLRPGEKCRGSCTVFCTCTCVPLYPYRRFLGNQFLTQHPCLAPSTRQPLFSLFSSHSPLTSEMFVGKAQIWPPGLGANFPHAFFLLLFLLMSNSVMPLPPHCHQ